MNRSRYFSLACALLTAAILLPLTACGRNYDNLYPFPVYNFAGRPIPPSHLANRVMVAIQNPSGLSSGALEILDANNDLRHNIQNTVNAWAISGYSANLPIDIQSFPDELQGYVYASGDGSFDAINYATEASTGSAASEPGKATSIVIDGALQNIYAGIESLGYLTVYNRTNSNVYPLNLPNVFQVATNVSGTVALAMVRNSNSLYRIIRLSTTANNPPTPPAGAIDCRPANNPLYCVVPVPGTFDHPIGAYFSLDGTQVYIINCGPECGGTTASISYLSLTPLLEDNPTIPVNSQVLNTTVVPGGATAAISDGTYLYVAGQQLQTNGPYTGLFAGNLSIISLATQSLVGPTYSISDGLHTKMIFGDNNTLWIGANTCAEGVRNQAFQAGVTAHNVNLPQSANYNCLTRFVIPTNPAAPTWPQATNPILPTWSAHTSYNVGAKVTDGTNIEVMSNGASTYTLNGAQITDGTSGNSTPAWNTALDGTTTDGGITWVNLGPVTPAQIEPGITPNNPNAFPIPINWLNTNGNPYYYGDLTGICWVQGLNKMYTAYGGQIHLFGTADGGEHDNSQITVQGTAFDVAYMDALTDAAN